MTVVVVKGIYFSCVQLAPDSESTWIVTLSDSQANSMSVEFNSTLENLKIFSKGLQNFPKETHDFLKVDFSTGAQYLAGEELKIGQIRLSAHVKDSSGYSELKLEILQPNSFQPGMKLAHTSGAEPLKLNRLGFSLEAWLSDPTHPLSFYL